MGHRFVVTAGALLLGGLVGCSSSSSPVASAGTDAGAGADTSADATLGDDTAAEAGNDATSGGQDTSQPIDDARADEGSSQPEVDASAACVTYCKCMAMNCADKVFPGGCLPECAAQTDWDLGCRTNMCTLVPAQPNNDHCTHAFGVNECLDQ